MQKFKKLSSDLRNPALKKHEILLTIGKKYIQEMTINAGIGKIYSEVSLMADSNAKKKEN